MYRFLDTGLEACSFAPFVYAKSEMLSSFVSHLLPFLVSISLFASSSSRDSEVGVVSSLRIGRPGIGILESSLRIGRPGIRILESSLRIGRPGIRILESSLRIGRPGIGILESSLRIGRPGIGILERANDFSVLQNFYTGSGDHPTFCSMGTGINWLRSNEDLLWPSTAEVEIVWRYTSTSPVCCHSLYKKKFYFSPVIFIV